MIQKRHKKSDTHFPNGSPIAYILTLGGSLFLEEFFLILFLSGLLMSIEITSKVITLKIIMSKVIRLKIIMSKVIMSMVKRPKIITPKKSLSFNYVRSGLMQHYLPKTIHDVITFDLIFSILYFRPLNFRCFTICFHFTLTKNGLSTREALMQEQLQSHFVGIFFRFFSFRFFSTLCQSQKVLFVPLFFKRRI